MTDHLDIPTSLWSNSILSLPDKLTSAYRGVLKKNGLLEAAKKPPNSDKIFGGNSKQDSDDHFTHRFVNSAGRTEFAVLSPDPALIQVSEALLSALSDGRVGVLDIPCGAGASTCALVATIAALRAQNVMPNLPLALDILGGDTSPHSRDLFAQMLSEMKPRLEELGIHLSWDVIDWDGTSSDSTAKLVDEFFSLAGSAEELIVSISNFSGALGTNEAFDQFSASFDQIVSRMHNRTATIAWIEPKDFNKAKKTFMLVIAYLVKSFADLFKSQKSTQPQSANYDMRDPMTQKVFQTGVAVLQLRRTSS